MQILVQKVRSPGLVHIQVGGNLAFSQIVERLTNFWLYQRLQFWSQK
jgi:hypothetical protein